MPSCTCGVWFKAPDTSGADELAYLYCHSCRKEHHFEREYIGGNCSFDLFSTSSYYNESESKSSVEEGI